MSRPENRIRGMGVALIQYQSFTGGDARLATVLRDNVASALDCSRLVKKLKRRKNGGRGKSAEALS